MIQVVTIEREYGSGGPAIAQKLADRLGWTLWDQALTCEIARQIHADVPAVRQREERKDPLYYRLFKSFLRGSFEGSLRAPSLHLLDADRIVATTEGVVRGAAAAGRGVIVGRGAQHFLRDREDAFHVFIYAPYAEKVRREQAAGRTGRQASALVETVDRDRAAFIRRYFGKDWPGRELYHLMVNSATGDEAVVETILGGMAALERQTAH